MNNLGLFNLFCFYYLKKKRKESHSHKLLLTSIEVRHENGYKKKKRKKRLLSLSLPPFFSYYYHFFFICIKKNMSRLCSSSFFVFVFSTGLVLKVAAYSSFMGLIPNGNNVPHPCDSSVNWNGVGHRLHQGGGPKNDFGQDFHDVTHNQWSMELCKMDSDGDGKTNGEELGDPNCIWTPGQVPAITNRSQLSHPGVCEPVDSDRCKLRVSFLLEDNFCRVKFNRSANAWCPAITGPNVRKMVLRFDQIVVPENETSYMCQEFQLPNDQDYQIIAVSFHC